MTGVQTCALPIYCCEQRDARQQQPERGSAPDLSQAGTGGDRDEIAKRGTGQQKADSRSPAGWSRSEERRAGKEGASTGRPRWSRVNEKKKSNKQHEQAAKCTY